MDDLPTQHVSADEGATVCLPALTIEFDRYVLLKELGKGGTGIVWLALDHELGANVALKSLRREVTSEVSALRDLKGEVLINRTLSHPHIVKTFDFVTDGRSSAISMEYVNGSNLHRLRAERPSGCFEVETIAKWVGQLCSALDYAHGKQVVHRDIKPANLLIDEHGDLKIGDFGIGRTVAAATDRLTRNSYGTPPYMSPQQMMGERAVPSDDIYSIGATVYDLLTGEPPFFRGAIREQAMAKIAPSMTERRKELGRAGGPIPPAWECAVAAALSKDAVGRPATAAELRRLFEGAPAAAAAPRSARRARWPWIAAIAAVFLAAVAAKLVVLDRRGNATRPPEPVVASPAQTQALALSPAALAPAHSEDRSAPVPAAAPLRQSPASAAAATPVPAATPPLDQLAATGQITADEHDLLRRALAGQQGEQEKGLAERLVYAHTLSPQTWRDYTGLVAPSDPIVEKLRPLLAAGFIREKEFSWLEAALAGAKGDDEKALAGQLVDTRELTAPEWRTKTKLYPPPPVDPIVEKVKPLFAAGLITDGERTWLQDALRGKQGSHEKNWAESLLDAKILTMGQWRAKTARPYPVTAESLAHPSQWPPAIDLPLGGGVVLRLLRVDPGPFFRGTAPDELGRRTNEPVMARATIDQPFYLGVYPVTQRQYTAIMRRSPSYWRGHPDWPIDQVDWASLTGPDGFLSRLNRALAADYGSTMTADVPSDDEWEYACRAGTHSSFYIDDAPIGNRQRDPTLDRLANYNRSDTGSPVPVGSYAPNAWGFYDMLGNVAEWCQDRSIRGGSWQSNAAGCRIGWRTESNSDSDHDPSPTQGFRLALRAR